MALRVCARAGAAGERRRRRWDCGGSVDKVRLPRALLAHLLALGPTNILTGGEEGWWGPLKMVTH